ncbi:MAG: Roadblock/LC7 domain protein [Candidatus Methanofastidiosum methylothiophilum]|uniref:Roadblock/LC7 domain protein n=1 Tax=Candidatus Methanofastidiosum methylothiophilum TaxID=1705564 RepID=A0A150J6P5_9EURY|nr:MAG: Roadblock/LC7 domain protein [Candidatus Methanofastidiosum methylthiophilus]
MAKPRTEILKELLKEFKSSSADVQASAVVSTDGLIIASELPQDVEEDRVAAMSAAMLSLGERTSKELMKGSLEQVFVKGQDGYILLMGAGDEAVLTALAKKDAKLGLVFLDMKRAADKISEVI